MSRLLLDTHAFLWIVAADPKISTNFAFQIESADELYISSASLWEIAIKVGLGKLQAAMPVSDLFSAELTARGVQVLPIDPDDAAQYSLLPFPDPNHRDPFDRMLVVQAMRRGIKLVSSDPRLDVYGVDRYWQTS